MSLIYELIGRLVVGAVWWRYGRQIRIGAAAGVGLAVLGAGAYLATREHGQEDSA
jgi:hypothetical protein